MNPDTHEITVKIGQSKCIGDRLYTHGGSNPGVEKRAHYVELDSEISQLSDHFQFMNILRDMGLQAETSSRPSNRHEIFKYEGVLIPIIEERLSQLQILKLLEMELSLHNYLENTYSKNKNFLIEKETYGVRDYYALDSKDATVLVTIALYNHSNQKDCTSRIKNKIKDEAMDFSKFDIYPYPSGGRGIESRYFNTLGNAIADQKRNSDTHKPLLIAKLNLANLMINSMLQSDLTSKNLKQKIKKVKSGQADRIWKLSDFGKKSGDDFHFSEYNEYPWFDSYAELKKLTLVFIEHIEYKRKQVII